MRLQLSPCAEQAGHPAWRRASDTHPCVRSPADRLATAPERAPTVSVPGARPCAARSATATTSNASHTASGTSWLTSMSTGARSTRRPAPPPVPSSSCSRSPSMALATRPAVGRSKCGSKHSTEFSRSLPGTRRASGVRTIRPRSWVMWVSSAAGRNDTSTSARGQSQPVEIASLANNTRMCVRSCTVSGPTCGIENPPISIAA